MEKIKLPIKEHIEDNITPSNPDFSWLGKMLMITIPVFIISYFLFYIFAYFVVWAISLEKEKELFSDITSNETKIDINKFLTNKIENLENIDIYFQDSEEINAYAMIWANIIITKWLLENIKNEEELIFIIWHEMEHIKNRDVLKSLLTDIPFYITLQFIWIQLNETIFSIATAYNSQTTEIEADNWWINLVNKMNLNLGCSLNFFEEESYFQTYLQFISTHPSNIKRIENIKKQNLNTHKECNAFHYIIKD